MRGLTLIRPWDEPVADGTKPIENRTWRAPQWLAGETIAIHAGKKYSRFAASEIEKLGYDVLPAHESNRVRAGRIVAVVRVVGCIAMNEAGYDDTVWSLHDGIAAEIEDKGAAWYFGPVGWLFDSAIALPRPVPAKGALGLWHLPADVEREVNAQVEEVRRAG